MTRPSSALVAALCAVVLTACGDDAVENERQTPISAEPGVGGTLTWAVADRIDTIDPLAADSRAEQLVSRQIHEPLTAELRGPFGDVGRVPGLALSARPSADFTVWTLNLRTGIRFRDGDPFNASAVLANATRWLESPVAQGLLPPFVIDAPRPDQVRFILTAPDSRLDLRLAVPELGIVSPRAIRRAPIPATPGRLGTGTGPFELREAAGGRVLLARNVAWWGSAVGLGPALDQVELRSEPAGAIRLALLEAGVAQAADELEPGQAAFAATDPLVTVLPSRGDDSLGLERSVRGIESANEIPPLSEAWLTTLTWER